MVLAGLNQGVVLTYDINRDMVVKSFEAHSDDANAVAFTDASTNVFISGSDDALCKVLPGERESERERECVCVCV